MAVVKINVFNLCMAFIDHGKHISTAEKFLNDHFNLTEEQFICVKTNIQRSILPKFNARWALALRKKDRFIDSNREWLNAEFIVDFENTEASTSTESGIKRGRPCKDYAESSELTKKKSNTNYSTFWTRPNKFFIYTRTEIYW